MVTFYQKCCAIKSETKFCTLQLDSFLMELASDVKKIVNARATAENKKGMKTISTSWLGFHICSHHHQFKVELSLKIGFYLKAHRQNTLYFYRIKKK